MARETAETPDVQFGPFRLDARNACVWREGQALSLSGKALALLRHLAGHPGALVTKEELLNAVWPQTIVGDAVLKVYVGEIRKALGDNPQQPQFIETVHRRGYRWVAPPRPVPPVASRQLSVLGQQELAAPVQLATRNWQLGTPLVGREAELAQLRHWLDDALGGHRQVVFVTGEPGIGKTTLVEAFLTHAQAAHDLYVAWGQCAEQYGGGEAYRPVLEAVGQLCRQPGQEAFFETLRRHAPTWLLQLPSLLTMGDVQRLRQEALGATQKRMLREMAEAVEALTVTRPLVVVLEDLQWGDYATLDLVAALARRHASARLLVVGTYRPVDVIVSKHPVKAVKQELLAHGQGRELPLELLSESAVVEYLTRRFAGGLRGSAGDFARVLHRRTGGNPLFVVNVVNDMIAQGLLAERHEGWGLQAGVDAVGQAVPENIRQMIERQIERLGAEEQRLLEAGSAAGDEFTIADVAAALEGGGEALEALGEELARREQFIRATGVGEWPDGTVTGHYRFIHALYRNVLYSCVAPVRQIRLHQRIGERREAAYGDRVREVAADLAVQFTQGRDYRRAVRYLRLAAENAARRYANREAVEYLTRALDLLDHLPAEERPPLHTPLLEQRGLIHRGTGNMQLAAADFSVLAACAHDCGAVDAEANALFLAASALSWINREQCLAVVGQAATLSDSLTDELLRVHTRGWAAYWNLVWREWRGTDVRRCAEAVAALRRADDKGLLGVHLGRYANFLTLQSHYNEACQAAQEAAHLARDTGDVFEYLLCQFFQAWALLHAGRWGAMRKVLDDATALAERNGHRRWELLLGLERAWLYEQVGMFDYAREVCGQGCVVAQEMQLGFAQLMGPILLGFAHLGLGAHGQAGQVLLGVAERLGRERVLMDWIWRMPLHLGLSSYWVARRDWTKARQEAEHLCAVALQPGERTYLALGHRQLAEVAAAQEHWHDAEGRIRQALAVLDGTDAPLAQWRVYASAAQLQQRRRKHAEARGYWKLSAAVLTRLADSLGDATELRQSFLAQPEVRVVVAHTGQV